jgi:hypothetical protein
MIHKDTGGKALLAVLFFGSIWGLLEATLGFGVKLLGPVFLSGEILFPLGAAVCYLGWRRYEKPWFPVGVGLVAACIKLSDGLLGIVPPFDPRIVNPAVAIVAESLFLAAAFSAWGAWRKERPGHLVPLALVAGLGWRPFFLPWTLYVCTPAYWREPTAGKIAGFLLAGGLLSVALVALCLVLVEKVESRSSVVPALLGTSKTRLAALAAGTLLLALACELSAHAFLVSP